MKNFVSTVLVFLLMLTPVYGGNGLGEIEVPSFQTEMEALKQLEIQQFRELHELKKLEKLNQIREIRQRLEALQVTNTEEFGEEVDEYTSILKELGYYKQDDDSAEEINNRNALIRFQSDHNLIVDGLFGSKSNETLLKRLKDDDFKHRDTINEAPTEEKWIVVNKTKRILTLYRGSQVIKKYPIAQGKLSNLTPEGKFSIVSKVINPMWGGAGIAQPVAGGSPKNPLGYRWMGLSIDGGSSYGIHGNNSPESIGTNASMGCIRMINSDVEELYNLVSMKTIVWIGTDEQLKEWGIDQTSYIKR
ncbi:L,D-transpeptidase family protein [Alkaliphilus hydrothermalis]|uniref:Lipoprotein-anchoring transpeptidase ErfK/SrfK n=1 Tax=Alkaliphilus hydrothermalis TaxID=1482730 RepID=A0ABS2NTW5_9FIRM|nr:L,D-transpeptidase family protein [Alkaliphilus hydrothermalis]MBM7616302.1 lipoprotein-anchoring transpeptidase ErfK/SrfK [Alkaliphilus hydrothermalis]